MDCQYNDGTTHDNFITITVTNNLYDTGQVDDDPFTNTNPNWRNTGVQLALHAGQRQQRFGYEQVHRRTVARVFGTLASGGVVFKTPSSMRSAAAEQR